MYIGSTINYSRRRTRQKSELKHGYHHNKNLQFDYDNLGSHCFEFVILEHCDNEGVLREREQYYIDQHLKDGTAYNISELSTSPSLPGEKNPMFGKVGYWKGKKMPVSARMNMSKSAKGKVISEETRRKMSQVRKGKLTGKDNPMFGRIFTEEERQHLSAVMSGERNHFYGKKHTEESRKKMSETRRTRKTEYGSNNPRAKLTKEQAIEIYYQVKDKKKPDWPDLSKYNISLSVIYSIKNEKHWAIKEYLNEKASS